MTVASKRDTFDVMNPKKALINSSPFASCITDIDRNMFFHVCRCGAMYNTIALMMNGKFCLFETPSNVGHTYSTQTCIRFWHQDKPRIENLCFKILGWRLNQPSSGTSLKVCLESNF